MAGLEDDLDYIERGNERFRSRSGYSSGQESAEWLIRRLESFPVSLCQCHVTSAFRAHTVTKKSITLILCESALSFRTH